MICSTLFQAVEEEISRHRQDLEALNLHADQLKSKGADSVVGPSLVKLNRRWHEVQAQFAQFRSPEDSPTSTPAESANNQQTDAPSESMTTETVTKTVVTTVTTTHVTRVVFSKVPAQFIEELGKLLALITDIQEELQSPVLHGQQYEDFSRQEDKLKVSQVKRLSHCVDRCVYVYVYGGGGAVTAATPN